MGMIIRRSLTPLNSSRTLLAVRQRETVRGSDDNSRRKVQNARGDSCASYIALVFPRVAQHPELRHLFRGHGKTANSGSFNWSSG
jgi:hypothetical protein